LALHVISIRQYRCFAFWIALMLAVASTGEPAEAQVKFEASYAVTLAGIPIGAISAALELDPARFNANVSAHTTGLVQIIANGSGEIVSSGPRTRDGPSPTAYAANVVIRDRSEKVQVRFKDRTAKDVLIEPEPVANGALLPLTDAHRKNVVDPLTASLVKTGIGRDLGPETCSNVISIFDGRLRYDLKLTFKRFEDVKTDVGYQGKAVVCLVSFLPIAGHDPNRFMFKYLAAQQDMEVWLAPVVGGDVAVPYRISIHTPMGLGVMKADRFVSEPLAVPSTGH
jgi:Protein of unknown function (DUF3108)